MRSKQTFESWIATTCARVPAPSRSPAATPQTHRWNSGGRIVESSTGLSPCLAAPLTRMSGTRLVQRAYLGKAEALCACLPSPRTWLAWICTSMGHPGCVKNSAPCHWLPTLHAYRALLIGAAFICTKRRRGPVLGQVRPTSCMQPFDVNSADCRPFPCRSRRARVKLPDQG